MHFPSQTFIYLDKNSLNTCFYWIYRIYYTVYMRFSVFEAECKSVHGCSVSVFVAERRRPELSAAHRSSVH